ncbi:MAG: DEAD/DEAH box helicase, partial [Planctomycetes bacterium]|nr:DEAD/DEAH box helicase [Planctomycetota bacterium]
IKTIEEIKTDMQTAVPMDRLLCGDVGYGKTELAMRAAFKAVAEGKQAAVLVPTTVLCVQHGRTFAERFADFPVIIETLNRFRTAKEAKDIIKKTKQGKIDILIGTHRLLSRDVGFKDLGLLIIDEEQRFGVEHKEKLKKLRADVDILTMTATPIPRTLHLSLMGLRNISSLATPPMDRRSVVTNIRRYSPELIKKAVLFEMNRRGQVFFLHNRVRSIEKMAENIKKLVPQARVGIAHGQMSKHRLEEAMLNFVLGRTDVLLCSTIIESGLDIPNANTIIINDADRFGLAQLHQLRGRVGRFKHRAYAYMLLPMTRTITPIAAKRLKAIEEYSQLGAGFRIALRDLEIRGAGNILGAQQSGHINTVGYELFCRLLGDTVKRMKNEPVEPLPMTVLDLGFSTYIPRDYIPSDRQRMGVYRQAASAKRVEDLRRLRSELEDLFGHVRPEVGMLIDMAELKIAAARWKIKSITVSGRDLIFSLASAQDGKGSEALFASAPGTVRIPDAKTVYVRLERNYFEPATLMSILRKMLRTNQDNDL